jgi:hypothetical protein
MIGVLPEAFVDPPDRSDTSDPKTPWLSTQPVGASRRSSDSERDASAFRLIFQPALPTSVTNQRYQRHIRYGLSAPTGNCNLIVNHSLVVKVTPKMKI